ncbi:Protein of unknown function [Gryllus bimaculatus]|nr:Protein of unknown function [Gryllus bimaculatus]
MSDMPERDRPRRNILDDHENRIPLELRQVLTQLALRYILDQPEDGIEYCYEFFMQIWNQRRQHGESSNQGKN